jgi:RNA-directed DNA polymerase
MKFSKVKWKSAYEWLREKQNLLVEVYKKGDVSKVRHLQILILKDFRTTAIGVRRVTTSSGSRTPGLDGVIITTTEERDALAQQVHSIVRSPRIYKPSAVKRVWIPKKDGSKRPLGIPTIMDRAVQAVYLEAIDPLVECNACENSFGFRKFRSAQDAVLALRGKLIHPKASEWILNADISKCFDRINHDFLLRSVPVYRKVDRIVLKKMLKAKIIDVNDVTIPEMGTPQGGVLSPVLCNVALNGLEGSVKMKADKLCKPILGFRGNPKVHVVRYADDFIVVGPSKRMLKVLRPHIENFLAERGMEISKAKSSLFNIREQDFEFLGFSFDKRRFNYKKRSEVSWVKKRSYKSTSRIIIKPSNDNLRKFKNKVRDIIGSHTDLSTLVLKLNEYLRGWAIYFATTGDSAECVRKLHRFVLRKCWDKVLKLHPTTPRKALRKRFFPKHKFYQLGRYVERSWVFSVPTKLERPSVKDALLRLFNLDSIRAPGNAQIPTGLNAYEKADRERLETRILYTNFPSGTVEKICRRQKFICPVCGQSLSNGEDIEVHHLPSLKDLRLHATPNTQVKTVALHKICHSRMHKELQKSSKI